jgi:serine phosphatase RsbU (regulator of sigma subunit)
VRHYINTTTRKVLFVLYGTMLALSVALVAWMHSGQMKVLKQEAYVKLGSITGTMAVQLDGGRVQHLLKRYDSRGMIVQNTQDAWYYTLFQTMRKGARANNLERPLRIVAYDAMKDELVNVVTSDDRPAMREPYMAPCTPALIAYLRADRVDPHRETFGNQVAAFDAVRNSRGTVVGAVVLDMPVDELMVVARGRTWRNIVIVAVLLIVVGIFLFRSIGRMVQTEETARTAWQEKHEGVTDSIAYAGKIQGALIPNSDLFAGHFAHYFVLNRPKDVVSGDFHWYHRISDDQCLVAAADCTGHGLPGAMMAAIGCSLLNELVVQYPHKDPAELLGMLNERMTRTLHQSGKRKGAGDGMDVALCRIDRKEREILFAGAFRPLYWMHEGQLTVINGDRQPIGGSQHDADRKFTVHRVAYHQGDRLYLFSDGYVDQFGGPERKKFMTARFNEILLASQHLPLSAQSEVLERAFVEWKGENEQVDDVCIVGLEV